VSAAALLRRIELAAHNEQLYLDLSARLVGEARATMLAHVRRHAAARLEAAAELQQLVERRHTAAQAVLARLDGCAA
jgi:hypothetical protein